MAIKVHIPLNASQISVEQFVNYHTARTDTERLMAATKHPRKVVESFQMSTSNEIMASFETAMNSGSPRHEQTFVMDGMRLGFIPDLNAMTLKEHVDLELYSGLIWTKDGTDYTHLPKLLAILFRPVRGKLGKFYEIEPYSSDTSKLHMERVMQMTMDRVNGALVFFSTIANECAADGIDSLTQMMKMEVETITQSEVA